MNKSRMDEPFEQHARAAIVIGRWGDDTALLRTEDGQTVEVPVPESLRGSIDVGAILEMTEDGSVDWPVLDDSAG